MGWDGTGRLGSQALKQGGPGLALLGQVKLASLPEINEEGSRKEGLRSRGIDGELRRLDRKLIGFGGKNLSVACGLGRHRCVLSSLDISRSSPFFS